MSQFSGCPVKSTFMAFPRYQMVSGGIQSLLIIRSYSYFENKPVLSIRDSFIFSVHVCFDFLFGEVIAKE